ncbi:MAG: outer membrane beta-barrel protein [Rhodomicrobiaceae bacterium]
MRKLAVFTAVAAFFCAAGGASAADLSMKDTPYEAAMTPIWGGLYVGGHLGGLWNDNGKTNGYVWERCKEEWKKTKTLTFSDDRDDVTLIGGVHVGYNWQDGARVLGVEGDVSFGDGLDYLGSLRARLGYARDNFLLYATAGFALAGFDDAKIDTKLYGYDFGTATFSGDRKVGAVVGGGVEYMIRPNWSVGVEGLYYIFGDTSDSLYGRFYCTKFKATHDDDNDLFVARARISYHFGGEEYEAPLK